MYIQSLYSYHVILDVVDSLEEGVTDVCKGFLRLPFEEEEFS